MSGGGGSLALGIVGGIVGSFFGMPQLGFAVGSLIGNLAFPPKLPGVEGPRLGDLKSQTSQYGRMIPIVFGRNRLAGNIIWQSNLQEVATETSQGGKGGPKQSSTTYTYFASWAVLLTDCKEGPIDGVRRIWDTVTGKLLYDVSPTVSLPGLVQSQNFSDNITVYLGTGAQLPDPTIEAYLGVGNVPAYRYRSYIVFTNQALEEFYNKIPALEFEVLQGATVTQYVRESLTDFDAPALMRVTYPRYDNGVFMFDLVYVSHPTFSLKVSIDLNGNYLGQEPGEFGSLYGDETDGTQGVYVGKLGNRFVVWYVDGSGETGTLVVNDNVIMSRRYSTASDAALFNLQGATVNASGTALYVFYRHNGTDRWRMYDEGLNVVKDFARNAMGLSTPPVPPSPIVGAAPMIHGISGSQADSKGCFAVESDDRHLWHFKQLSITSQRYADLYYIEDDGTFTLLKAFSAAGETGDPAVNTTQGGIAADKGVACGLGPQGNIVIWSRIARLGDSSVSLSSIVTTLSTWKNFDDEITLESGDLNVSGLTDSVNGYVFSQRTTVRSGLEQLAQAFPFDAVESDGEIKFVRRGGDVAVEIPDDDLGAYEYGSDPADLVSIIHQQEIEVPSEITVLYPDIDNAYQIGTQTSRRVAHVSGDPQQIQLPVSMDASYAKQISDILRYDSLTSRDTYSFSTTRKYAHLEPTDVIIAGGRKLRIVKKTETPGGLIQWDSSAEDSTNYTKTYPPAVWATDGQEPSLVGPTGFVPLDIPLLRDADDDVDNGFYAVARAYYDAWTGALVYKSSDGGSTYAEIGVMLNSGYTGTATTALGSPNTSFAFFDRENSVTVQLPSGISLSSLSESSLLASQTANAILIGDEIIRYATVVDNGDDTYTLSILLRGLRGTEWAAGTHAINDRVVILDAAKLNRLPNGTSDINVERTYKVISLGLQDGSTIDFTNTGESDKPYSPVLVGGAYNGIDAWRLKWVRRTRVGGDWINGSNAPLSEESEEYEIEILDGSTVVRTITGITEQLYDYSEANSITDFGSLPSAVTFNVYQISASVGRGHAGQGTAVRAGTYDSVILLDSPIAYYKLDETTGNFVDSVGGYNSTAGSPSARGQPSLVAGGGKSVLFTQVVAQRIILPTTFPQLGTTWSLEAWIKPTGNAGHQGMIARDTAAWGGGFPAFYFKNSTVGDGKPVIGLSTGVASAVSVTSPTALTVGNIYHIVATCDNTTLSLYVNGVLKSSAPTLGAVLQTQTGAPVLACGMFADNAVDPLWGGLDNVAIYSTALSADRVLAHYLAG